MNEEQLTGLALMNVHSDISLHTKELISTFAKKDKLDDMDYLIIYIAYICIFHCNCFSCVI